MDTFGGLVDAILFINLYIYTYIYFFISLSIYLKLYPGEGGSWTTLTVTGIVTVTLHTPARLPRLLACLPASLPVCLRDIA